MLFISNTLRLDTIKEQANQILRLLHSIRISTSEFCSTTTSTMGMGVGLSILIGIKSLTLFIIFTYLQTLGFTLLSIPILYASLISLLISLASHPSINLPMLLAKNTDGTFPIWSLIIFSPYLYFVRAFSSLRRLKSREEPYTEIVKDVYVGGWPSSPEKMPPGKPAVVDCTCELPRVCYGNGYLCVATWDTRSPDAGEIERAVKWACRKRTQGIPVFVHCAYGKSVLLRRNPLNSELFGNC